MESKIISGEIVVLLRILSINGRRKKIMKGKKGWRSLLTYVSD